MEKPWRKCEGMRSLVLIAVDLESKRQWDGGILGGWCNIFTCTIFHYSVHANVNTCPIHVCSLDCAVHAKMTDVLHKEIFFKTGKMGAFSECYTENSCKKFEVF